MEKIVIVGGGAAGLVAAINAKNEKNEVIILERNASCGKKILATGNGKCNYWNSDQDMSHYHSHNQELLSSIITEELQTSSLNLFKQLGVYPKIKNGYYYPFSNQATTIKNALLKEIERKKIIVKNDFFVEKIKKQANKFEIEGQNEIIKADKVIISTGSKAAPKTGSDGNGYTLLKRFGHKIIEPLPALVQLKTKGNYLKNWTGIRTDVIVSLYENNQLIKEEAGEIQLTDYGISGICVFNLSRYISIGLKANKQENICINFMPFIKNKKEIEELFNENRTIKDNLDGILNNKLVEVILKETKINQDKKYEELSESDKSNLISNLTNFKVEVIGTNSYEQAQVCTGGIPLTEINLTKCESKLIKGLYIIGELLDVDGDCGGYNLGFAWMSGILAGKGCNIND